MFTVQLPACQTDTKNTSLADGMLDLILRVAEQLAIVAGLAFSPQTRLNQVTCTFGRFRYDERANVYGILLCHKRVWMQYASSISTYSCSLKHVCYVHFVYVHICAPPRLCWKWHKQGVCDNHDQGRCTSEHPVASKGKGGTENKFAAMKARYTVAAASEKATNTWWHAINACFHLSMHVDIFTC